MLRFLNKVIKITVITVFFIVFGLDFLKWNFNFALDNIFKINFDISSLNNHKYNIGLSTTQEQIDIMTRRPLRTWLEVSFPKLEKEKKNGNR